MKMFFVNEDWSDLADAKSSILSAVKGVLIAHHAIEEVCVPERADVILIQEKTSYKNFRYIDRLLRDPVLAPFVEKVFTINTDDCATGLLRGLYTSLPKSRFDARIHGAIPYMDYPNQSVFSEGREPVIPRYLASWRGNTVSNRFRSRMINALARNDDLIFETTDSWLNHGPEEKETYVDLILNSKFSLCPAGWAPVTFRIYESMALGRCPIILADEFVPPAGPDWDGFSYLYPQRKIESLAMFLHAREHLYMSRGAAALRAWNSFFSEAVRPRYFSEVLLSLIRCNPATDRNTEIKRWHSLKLYWSNRWTLPQRVINKASRWSSIFISP